MSQAMFFILSSESMSENPGLESRLQAASRRNRLKAGLQTQLGAVTTLFRTALFALVLGIARTGGFRAEHSAHPEK
jgi:hypothetical protein